MLIGLDSTDDEEKTRKKLKRPSEGVLIFIIQGDTKIKGTTKTHFCKFISILLLSSQGLFRIFLQIDKA